MVEYCADCPIADRTGRRGGAVGDELAVHATVAAPAAAGIATPVLIGYGLAVGI